MFYKIGLDLGIASCGAAAIEVDASGQAKRILSLHSRTFDKAEVPKTGASLAEGRRLARGLRRRIRRKVLRLDDLRKLLGQEDMSRKIGERDVNELRCAALDEKISERDFARVLYSIAKHRGFKSNRKNASSKEDGKLLAATKQNDIIMQDNSYRTVGEMLYKHYASTDPNGNKLCCTRNKGGDYSKTVSRDRLIEEAKILFAKQRELGNILADENTEEKFIEIFTRQRSFDEGPGKGSPYSSNFAVGMFNGEFRAPKYSYTVDYSNALQKINNLKIQGNGEERFLSNEERASVRELLNKKTEIKYKDVRKLLALEAEYIFNISYQAPKKKGEEEKEITLEEIIKKAEDKVLVTMKNSTTIAKALSEEHRNRDIIDEVAKILLFNKSEERIREQISDNSLLNSLGEEEVLNILQLDCTKTSNLSLSALKAIEPYLEQGFKYSEAMEKADISADKNGEKSVLLQGEDMRARIDEITSPVVKRSVSQAVKVINALIREYGSPVAINIELAREMSKTFEERKKIEKDNKEREESNNKLRAAFKDTFGRDPKSSEFIKYKLYEEQGGKCPYSGKVIDADRLFKDEDYAQVDHILPYSKSFDDSFSNKVLVLTKENQDKRNDTAMAYQIRKGREKEYRALVYALYKDNPAKREKLLKEKIDETEWKNRALNDTSYLSRFVQNLLQDYLYFTPLKNVKRTVYAVKGKMTATLRRVWGINKVREDGDLHHAVDAAIIAVMDSGVIKNLTEFYKMKENVKLGGGEYTDEETGEVFGYKEVAILLKRGAKQPYKDFVEELRIRCLPDKDSMVDALQAIGYTQEQIEAVKPVFVSRMPRRKAIGTMHAATYMSAKHIDEGFVTVKTFLTKLSYDKKKDEITGYYDKSSDIKLYNLLLSRLKEFDGNAQKAFAEPVYKPTKDGRQGPIVRSVKIKDTSTSGMLIDKTNALVGNDAMIRIDIFAKCGKYYAVPIYVADLYKGILPNKVATAGKNEDEWPQINDSYQFLFTLHKDDLVYIEHKKGIELKKTNDNIKSALPKTMSVNATVLYYESFNRRTASIEVSDIANAYSTDGVGITTLLQFKKYTVDVLGNYHEVKSEKRLPLELKKKR